MSECDHYKTILSLCTAAFTSRPTTEWSGTANFRRSVDQYLAKREIVDAHLKTLSAVAFERRPSMTIQQVMDRERDQKKAFEAIVESMRQTWRDYCREKYEIAEGRS